jgi:hypothetical protein
VRRTSDVRTCPKCGFQKPRTEQFWYFKQSGPSRGQVTGYCRKCQASYCRHYDATVVRTGIRLARKYAAAVAS